MRGNADKSVLQAAVLSVFVLALLSSGSCSTQHQLDITILAESNLILLLVSTFWQVPIRGMADDITKKESQLERDVRSKKCACDRQSNIGRVTFCRCFEWHRDCRNADSMPRLILPSCCVIFIY
jgi:hypothetical protein